MYVKTKIPQTRSRRCSAAGTILAVTVAAFLVLAGCEQLLTAGSDAQPKEAVEQQSARQSAESGTEAAGGGLRAWFLPPLAPEPVLAGEAQQGSIRSWWSAT